MAEEARIGQGFDVHQFEDGDGVILCGVKIPCSFKLKGHSDADVAWHALTDAILGAIGCGDIGEYFPPSDDKWKGADSAIFLKYAGVLAFEQNYKINNVDITIICEEPKLSAYKKDMASKTAEILRLTPNRVNIKGTTTEKLGFTGRGEGIAALAVILLSQNT